MLTAGCKKTGLREVLVAGGVAASALLRNMLESRLSAIRNAPEAVFGKTEMSGDNAVGVAMIGLKQLSEIRG